MLNILDFKLPGERENDLTHAFKKAFQEISRRGGGQVEVPAGEYESGPIDLVSNLELHFEPGAVLKFSNNAYHYPAVHTRYEGANIKMHHPCIYGDHIRNTAITGNGIIDGNGSAWWQIYRAHEADIKASPNVPFKYSRPYLLAVDYSDHIIVDGVKLVNSPAWTIHPLECQDVWIHNVTIDNPLDSPNTDGIDPESSTDVKITGCKISDGDDCIAIKSGIESTRSNSGCQNLVIANNLMRHGHGGIVFGSEMSGGICNVAINNNVFDHTDRGIRMKTRRGRGGKISNVTISNTIMTNVLTPIAINSYYGMSGSTKGNYLSPEAQAIDAGTPMINNIKVSQLTASNVNSVAGFIYGLPESPITNITLNDVLITMSSDAIPQPPEMIANSEAYAKAGFWLENTNDCKLMNVELLNAVGDLFVHNANNQDLKVR